MSAKIRQIFCRADRLPNFDSPFSYGTLRNENREIRETHQLGNYTTSIKSH